MARLVQRLTPDDKTQRTSGLAKPQCNPDGYTTFLHENSRYWQRRPRTRAYMEAAAIAACGPDFLRAGKCRDWRNCRERRDTCKRFDGTR